MRKLNRNHRYRLKPHETLKLGLEPNKENRYVLTDEQEKQLFNLDQDKIKRLFFDIETSPCIGYFWQPSYKARITFENIIEFWKVICISYKWENEETVKHLSWDENQCDKQMLIDFVKIMNEADECIAHNGDRFDIKKIRTRCVFHRIPMFPKYRSLDTLKKARSGFAFPSNRLNDIGLYLGVGAKLETGGFSLWKDVMLGKKEALDLMLDYCDKDVILLEDVWFTMQNYILNNTHTGTHNGKLKASCPNCASEDISLIKNSFTAKGTIKRLMECNSCGYDYEISNSAYRNFLEIQQQKTLQE